MSYSLPQWLMFFYLYCFFGWVWESCYVSVLKRRFVNRGFLHLPLLPLYGSGAVLVLFVTLPVREYPVLVYLAGAVSATALEYVVGVAMEALYKIKYWDYSHKKFNFQGVICLESTLFWGVLTVALVYAAHSPVERLVFDMEPRLLWGIDACVSVVFLYDAVISNREALRLARVLTALEKAKLECQEELRELELQLAEQRDRMEGRIEYARDQAEAHLDEFREQTELRLDEYREQTETRLDEFREQTEMRLDEIREQTEEHREAAREQAAERSELLRQKIAERRRTYEQRREALLGKAETLSRGILRRNPTATSRRYGEAVRELHSRIQNLRRK